MTYFFNNSGELTGYIAWACVIKETVYRLFINDELPIYYHEWNEGRITLIIDVCFKDDFPSKLRVLLKFTRDNKLLSYKRSQQSKGKVWIYRKNTHRGVIDWGGR